MKKGFTLIELLAVIIILSIIALIATPIVLNVVEDAKKSAGQSEANLIMKGIVNYCEQEKIGFVDNKYCSNESLKDNIDKIVNLGKVNKDTINVKFDENGNLLELTLKSNDNYYELKNNMMELMPHFATDSWKTIQNNIKNGKTSMYNVGDQRKITLTETPSETLTTEGTYTLRIANMSSNECKNESENFSQTACGFVVEFVDIIDNSKMNYLETDKSGWPISKMFNLLNDETDSIYSVLPEDLKKVIIPTFTVSSHGLDDVNNFTSNDNKDKKREKLYLLATRELWGDSALENSNDSANANTRQLDYYKINNVSISNKLLASKKNHDKEACWWLRSADLRFNNYFYRVSNKGSRSSSKNINLNGISPAFRIG